MARVIDFLVFERLKVSAELTLGSAGIRDRACSLILFHNLRTDNELRRHMHQMGMRVMPFLVTDPHRVVNAEPVLVRLAIQRAAESRIEEVLDPSFAAIQVILVSSGC